MAGMNLPEPYRRVASRYQRLAPVVGIIGTLWGIHRAFQRVHAGMTPAELWLAAPDAVETLGVAALAGFAVFLALLVIERSR